MDRRDFVIRGAAGTLGMGVSGCSIFEPEKIHIKQEQTPIEFDKKIPKPQGSMPMTVIGTTGIKVSKFGFGSHMRQDIISHEKEREWMVREAYDLGMNFFDVYDYEQKCFQYEPMGRYLAPVMNDVVISITMWPYEGRTVEQEMERDLRLFGRDYIDLVRIHAWKDTRNEKELQNQSGHRWEWWETLFKLKEKGYIRAVGVPVHLKDDLKQPLSELPLDFVIFPYNFYHNWTWFEKGISDVEPALPNIHKKGIGIISMKPFAGDYLVTPFKRLAAEYDKSGEVHFTKACLRYVIHSGLPIDATLGGMYNPYHMYENIDAFFNPEMSDRERMVLKKIRDTAKVFANGLLPEHYHFLNDWVSDSLDDSDLFDEV